MMIAIALMLLAAAQALPSQDGKAYAQALIDKAQAAPYFVNATGGAIPTVRHGASGLVCRFDPSATTNMIVVFPPSAYGAKAGEDVGCNTRWQVGPTRMVYSLYATRYPGDSGRPATVLAKAEAEVRAVYANVKPWTGPTPSEGAVDAGTLTARFTFDQEGAPFFSKIAVTEVGGWTIMLRASGRPEEAEVVDILTRNAFSDVIRELRATGR
jgi:hypothetical protein